MRQGGYLQRFS